MYKVQFHLNSFYQFLSWQLILRLVRRRKSRWSQWDVLAPRVARRSGLGCQWIQCLERYRSLPEKRVAQQNPTVSYYHIYHNMKLAMFPWNWFLSSYLCNCFFPIMMIKLVILWGIFWYPTHLCWRDQPPLRPEIPASNEVYDYIVFRGQVPAPSFGFSMLNDELQFFWHPICLVQSLQFAVEYNAVCFEYLLACLHIFNCAVARANFGCWGFPV